MDEFKSIADFFRPLTNGAPEALDLADDAAVIPARPGYDLVVTKDAMVEGVHFLAVDPLDWVARKLLRVNLSDLAAKAAEPYGYFLAVAWPRGFDETHRALFARGLAQDQERYGLSLFGGDTVSTPGPLTLSLTALGWTPAGRMVKRSGARPGDLVLVSGCVGDGVLGLAAAQGGLQTLPSADQEALRRRFHLPEPRLSLRPVLREFIAAAADVSDGLLADAAHVAQASGVGLVIDLEAVPASPAASLWIRGADDELAARLHLASGGDDYEIIAAVRPENCDPAIAAARSVGVPLTPIGRFTSEPGVIVRWQGAKVTVDKTGWSHT